MSHLAAEAEQSVTGRLRVLERFAYRWFSQGQPLDPEDWRADSQIFLEGAAGFTQAEWVDRRGRVRWRVRPGGSPVKTKNAELAPPRCLARALARPGVSVCGLSSSRRVVAAVAARREGHVVGYVVGTYDAFRLFDATLSGAPGQYYPAPLFDEADRVRGVVNAAWISRARRVRRANTSNCSTGCSAPKS